MGFSSKYSSLRIVIAGFFLSLNLFSFSQSIVINEVMNSNKDLLYDEDGDTPDWVELYNAGSFAVDLNGWSLTDDATGPGKWKFPARIINPGDFIIVYISDKDRYGNYLHTNFSLKGYSESLFLFDASTVKIDEHSAMCVPLNYSYGRVPDGSGNKGIITNPSPGSTNGNSNTITINPVKDTVIFSTEAGFYANTISLSLRNNTSSTTIFYSTDGSEPDARSNKYLAPLTISDRTNEPNDISAEVTSDEWQKPRSVFKGTVIRAVAYSDGCPVSGIKTNTYLVSENIFSRYTFPVISLSVDRSDFFGKRKGIYVPGLAENGNFNQSGEAWERPVHLEYFNASGKPEFEYELGARIHGRGTRYRPQKSLRLYTGSEYGTDSIRHEFFSDKNIESFKRIILRTPAADISNTLFKDELAHTLVSEMNMDHQAHLPVIVFINGEYWGIHNLRERQDKYYIQNNYGYDPDSLDMLGLSLDGAEEIEGDAIEYNKMIAFIQNNDLSVESNYQYIQTQMDIDNFIDYNISRLFLADYDWPRNNVRYWKKRGPDSKWRWLFFDCDYCFIQDFNRHLYLFTVGEKESYEEGTFLMRSLLKNKNFREQFFQKFLYHLNTTFEPGKVISTIESFKKRYAPMIPEHTERWNVPLNYYTWNENVDQLNSFAVYRPVEMLKQLKEIYGNPFTAYPNPSKDILNIKMYAGDELGISVKLFDMLGKNVVEKTFNQQDNSFIDVSQLSPGIYLLQLQYGNMLFSQKLVVQ